MVAIPPRSVEAFLRKPDPAAAIILLYGPDTGLVSERAKALATSAVDDPADPFQLVRLEGDDLAGDPGRLADEAATIPLFGGRRAIWIRAGTRGFAPALEAVLDPPPAACRIIIEGGDWRKSHPLVALVERSRACAAIACYTDEAAAITDIIAGETAAANLAIAPEARDALLGLLGGDRLASRSEIRKLCLYAAGAGRIELADVEAVVGDATLLATDAIVDAAFGGAVGPLDAAAARAWGEGINPSVLAGAALRHAMLLHRLRGEVEKGRAAATLVEAAGATVHFRRKAGVTRQLETFTLARLDRVVADLAETVLDCRRNPALAEAIASRALTRVALAARAR